MKRSSSAPNVPDLLSLSDLKQVIMPANLGLLCKRGLSNSNNSLPGDFARPELSPKRQPNSSSLPLSRINSPTSRQHRVAQIKKEETIDERENEREVQEQLLLNKTLDDSMRLHTDDHDVRSEVIEVWPSPTMPTSSFVSPSSPLTSKMMRSRSLTPTSPSSAQTFFNRRSCSPVMRPSSLCIQFGQKRKRELDQEDMDTSPTIPSKKQQLGYNSSFNPSPCVSPLTGNFPLHHSFSTASRKSSTTQSDCTPLSSPSSLSTNPFAIKYDSGNYDHWHTHSDSASGSTCSSTGHSPSVGYNNQSVGHNSISQVNSSSLSLDDINNSHRFGSSLRDDHRGVVAMDSAVEVLTETPTPLSPKGLQFRQKLFTPSFSKLPSPIPRPVNSSSSMDTLFAPSCSSNHGMYLSPPTSSGARCQPHSVTASVVGGSNNANHKFGQHQQALQHDKLSPFVSDVCGHGSIHDHLQRTIHLNRLQKDLSNVKSGRQKMKPEPLRSSSADGYLGHSASPQSFVPTTSRLIISSPRAKLSTRDHFSDRLVANKVGTDSVQVRQLPRKRRMSDSSLDSQEDSFMESEHTVDNFEDTLGGGGKYANSAVHSIT